MKEKLLEELETYLNENNEDLLTLLIDRAIGNIKTRRNYPATWDSEKMQEDIERFHYTVFDAVVYAYSKMGADFQQSHGENGISRSWIDEGKLYADVVPYVKII